MPGAPPWWRGPRPFVGVHPRPSLAPVLRAGLAGPRVRPLGSRRSRGDLVVSALGIHQGEHLGVTFPRVQHALVACMVGVWTKIRDMKTCRQYLEASVGHCEVIVKSMICDEHIGAWLLPAPRAIGLLILPDLLHGRVRPAIY